jgi:hypothetical protein
MGRRVPRREAPRTQLHLSRGIRPQAPPRAVERRRARRPPPLTLVACPSCLPIAVAVACYAAGLGTRSSHLCSYFKGEGPAAPDPGRRREGSAYGVQKVVRCHRRRWLPPYSTLTRSGKAASDPERYADTLILAQRSARGRRGGLRGAHSPHPVGQQQLSRRQSSATCSNAPASQPESFIIYFNSI